MTDYNPKIDLQLCKLKEVIHTVWLRKTNKQWQLNIAVKEIGNKIEGQLYQILNECYTVKELNIETKHKCYLYQYLISYDKEY